MTRILLSVLLAVAAWLPSSVTAQCTANFSAQPDSCLTWDFTDLSTATAGMQTWSWTFGDGGSATTQNATHSYTASGAYQVCLTIGTTDSCTSTYCDTVIVNCGSPCPQPNASWYYYCDSTGTNAIAFNNTSTHQAGATAQWSFGDGGTSNSWDAVHTYASTGPWVACLTVTDTCGTSTWCDTVYVNCGSPCPQPAASWYYYCDSTGTNAIAFNNTSAHQPGATAQWSFGDGGTSSSWDATHTYASAGPWVACLTVTDTCGTSTWCDTVYVNCGSPCPQPAASWYYYCDSTGTNAIAFNNTSAHQPGATAQWSFGDGGTSSSWDATHTYASAGPWVACLTVTDTCGTSTWCDTVYVNCGSPCPQPNASWYHYCDSTGTNAIAFNNTSAHQPGATAQWSFGDGGTSSSWDATHTYASAGPWVACLTVTDTCGTSTWCDTVYVNCGSPCPQPNASWYYYCDSTGTNAIAFNNTSAHQAGATAQWSFGDGGTSNSWDAVHTYASVGPWVACLTVTDTCGTSTWCDTVYVNCGSPCPQPAASWYYYCDSTGTNAIAFNNTSAHQAGATAQWSFGDGGTSNSWDAVHTYASTGPWVACLTVTDTCGTSTWCDTVYVNCGSPCPQPNASWFSYCDSTGTNAVAFSNTSATQAGATAQWSFGDGGTSSTWSPTHTYASAGPWVACLTVSDTCGTSTWCDTVYVNCGSTCPQPTASWYYNCDSTQANTMNFFNSSAHLAGATMSWTFGDGNSSTAYHPTHTYSGPGPWNVCLVVTDSCGSDTSCMSVSCASACPQPTASWYYNCDSTQANTMNFFNSSAHLSGAAMSWTFGDGNSSTAYHPTHTYSGPGPWNVCLVVTDSCGSDTSCMSVTCAPPAPDCDAEFSWDDNCGTVDFTDGSSASPGTVTSWSWSFGDGGTSSLQSPTHTYTAAGDYNVCLTIQTSDSCVSTYCDSVVTVGPNQCIAPASVQILTLSDTEATLSWDKVCGVQTYKIVYRDAGSPTWTDVTFKYNGGTHKKITGLSPGTTYKWAVRAKCTSTWGPLTKTATFTTLSGACLAPTGLDEAPVQHTKAKLLWGPVGNALKYRIRWRAVGASKWTKLAKGTVTHHWLSGLTAGTAYEWQIKSVCQYGNSPGSPWSALQTFTTASLKWGETLNGEAATAGSLLVFPNPSSNGLVTLQLELSASKTVNLEVVNAIGQVVLMRTSTIDGQTAIQLDLSDQPKGIYFLRATGNSEQLFERIVLQ